jgi:hypothetical protein
MESTTPVGAPSGRTRLTALQPPIQTRGAPLGRPRASSAYETTRWPAAR